MKRMWIGIGLLAAVLITGIWSSGRMEQIHRSAAEDLEKASRYVLEEDWDKALALAGQAESRWRKQRSLIAAFAEHGLLENIEGLFAQLKVFAKTRDKSAYGSTCVHLAQQIQALGESHRLNLQNLL